MPTFEFDAVVARLLDKVYGLVAALPLLLLALVLIWLGWLLGGWVSRRKVMHRLSRRNPLLSGVVQTTARWLITALAILMALEILEATTIVGAMLGTAGVLGIVIGLAFKDVLENYLAGVLMSFRQPFAPRDEVVIDGEAGTVMALTSRATILMTPDGNHLRLPNAKVFRAVILNYTRNPVRRFEFEVGIGVHEDLLQARTLGLDRLAQLNGVLENPPPSALILTLGDSSVHMSFRAWVDQRQHDFWMVRSEGIRSVKLALEAAGLDMPEPTYRLQWKGAQAGVADAAISAGAPRPTRPPAHDAGVPTPDTRARSDLEDQITRDQQQSDAPNLLDQSAPRE
ncbi:MAG TPA: mechanosensitive ion channel family protein [Steroidobacteraceae bacterium]|nr:mechanosensitive ion channel family protein [Steroidobacteraceae bacterium]